MGGIVVFGFAIALIAVACYGPMLVDGHFACKHNTDCPSGFYCASDCGTCYHDTPAGHDLARTCAVGDITGSPDGGVGGGSGAGGINPGGSGGGGGQAGSGGGMIGGGGGAGAGGPGGAVGVGGYGGIIVAGSGGMPGVAGMTGTAGATGNGGHVGAGGTTGSTGGRTGAGGVIITGSGGAPGAGGKTGAGGAMGLGGAMMGTGGAPAGGLGSKCSVGTQCASTFCVDGVCCNNACAGQCQACDISPGTCSLVTSGPVHGARPICGGAGICGAQCTLTTAVTAACLFAPMTTTCGPQTCKGSMLTLARFCDGSGNCTAGASGSCPSGLKCNADQTACLASCATNGDCNAPAPNCNPATHQCTAAGPIGSSCSVAADCQNGLCIDNFCCDAACSGSCQACNNMGQEGHCSLVLSGQPHGARTPCGASGTTCGGRCDGTDALCHFPMGDQCACPAPIVGLIGGTCDGTGNCVTAAGLCIL